jgi:hypothetical protein
MKNVRTLATALVAISLLAVSAAWGQGDKEPSSKNSNVEQQIRTLHEQMRQATLKGDTRLQEQYFVDDIIGIGPDGKMVTKDQMIQMRKSGRVKFEVLREHDVKVRVYGNTVIMNASVSVRETIDGKPFAGGQSATFVFVKQQGIWKEIGFQVTPLLEAK